jgi:flavin reductase (DIM6/NTAB) family NADH-FMN oxidoreductase RutF
MDFFPKAHQEDEFITHTLEDLTSPYPFFNSLIVPRPIAFVTTKGENGIVNAAPFSYFNAVCSHPTMISLAIEWRDGQRKDTPNNILKTKEFVINICNLEMAKAVTQAGQDYPPHISEIELAKLSLIPSMRVSVPRIANSPIHLECVLQRMIEIEESRSDLFIGKIVKVHLHKILFNSEGRIDFSQLNPLARLSGKTFASLGNFFEV